MQSPLALVRPEVRMEGAIWAYRQEFLDYGHRNVNGSCGLHFFPDFASWFEVADAIVKDRLSRDGVHASTFFSIRQEDGKIIGSIQLRHSLSPALKEHGGHIGYAIRPSERGKGYGRWQLLLVLEKARNMGIRQVMISCDSSNEASKRTILSCGGILTRQNQYRGEPQDIYWIYLDE